MKLLIKGEQITTKVTIAAKRRAFFSLGAYGKSVRYCKKCDEIIE